MSTPSPAGQPVPGRILGLGTDIIEVVRIGHMLDRHGEQFLRRVYTTTEVEYCHARRDHTQHFAGRWAAKEAVMKTLGTGWAHGVTFRDIEVRSNPGGRPSIVLSGGAGAKARELGITEVLVTISHCRAYATATAIAMG